MLATLASYAALIVVGSALYCYYNPDVYKRWTQQLSPQTTDEAHPPSKKAKPKRGNKVEGGEKGTSTAHSSNEVPASKTLKRKIVSAPIEKTVDVKTAGGSKTTIPRVEDNGLSNTDFAQQLRQAQTGTKLEQKTQQGPSKKDRRTMKAASNAPQGFESPNMSADTSSTGGRDADDDMSPNDTPPSSVSRADDVSDMLESGPAKPQTLRLTSTEEAPQKKPTPKFETVLTKKQRQRRQKNEENRVLREEADKQQEAKKQQQMRTARMAEGSSNQTKASSFTQNAWQSKPAEKQASTAQSGNSALLDTFEPDRNKESVSTKPVSEMTNRSEATVEEIKEDIGQGKTEALAASSRERPNMAQQKSWADQVNADEQDQWADKLLGQDEWNEVSTKKTRKNKKKENQDTSSEASQPLSKTASVTKPTNTVQTNGNTKSQTQAQTQNQNRFEAVGGDDVWEA